MTIVQSGSLPKASDGHRGPKIIFTSKMWLFLCNSIISACLNASQACMLANQSIKDNRCRSCQIIVIRPNQTPTYGPPNIRHNSNVRCRCRLPPYPCTYQSTRYRQSEPRGIDCRRTPRCLSRGSSHGRSNSRHMCIDTSANPRLICCVESSKLKNWCTKVVVEKE